MNGFSDVLSTPVRRALIVAVAAAISLFAWQLVFNASPAKAAYTTTIDENGANDEPGQKDLTQHAVDPSGAPTSIDVKWSWDTTGFSGSNTGDACTMFDTDNDLRVNFALCVTIHNNPAVQSSLSPRLFTCGDSKVDRCTTPTQLVSFGSTCTVAITATDPFPAGEDFPSDTTATCHILLADVGAGAAKLVNTCSYPSDNPNSDPSDCVLIVREGVLIIRKVATPNDATAQFGFKLDGGATNVFTANGSQTSDPIAVTTSTTHSLAETAPTGWQLDSASCSDGSGTLSGNTLSGIAIASDEVVTCTFNNSQQTGTLTVIKHVVNDNGGTLAAGDFSLHVKSGATDVSGSPQAGAESPGTAYTLNTGTYNVSENSVSGYSQSYSGDCNSSGDVTLPAAGSKTCTITNNDIAPKLTVIKHVINDSGGTAAASAFTMTVDDPGTNPADFPGAESPGTEVTVDAGTYSVSETGPSGYAMTQSADCSGTLAIGQTKTCTVTNNDIAPQLIVIKHVINDSGGTASASAFTMTVDDPGTNPADFPGAESPGTNVTVDPGSYSVSETGPSGYAQTQSSDCTGSIAIGETKTCTVTNNDIAPKLIVIKHVINDSGGTASASDFTMTVDDPGTNPADFPGAESPGTNVTVDPGSYSVSETGPSGYAETDSADCSGSIAIGETKTCTVTNNDIAPKLIVIKHVINDSGGTASASNFTMTVDDPGTNPADFPGAESPGTNVTVDPGSYSVSETGPSGYAETDSADCTGSIAIGETKTCTVTNNDIAPKLIVIKHVINDSGGTASAGDFTMTVDDPGTNPADFPGAESPGTNVTVDPGGYSVSETGPFGYAETQSSDCLGSIAIGETKTCTVTNDDIAPKVTVIKHVINDSGGTASAGDFTMTVDDPGTNPADFPGAESPGTNVAVDPGAYTVSETGPSGYAATYSADCDATIAIGQEKTCTVTNDDIAPKLVVIKHVINDSGGTASASGFTMTVDDPGTNPADFPGAESPGTNVTVDPGSYSVGETGPSGYASSFSADCAGSIAIGETKTCTVTNNDIAPKLIVIKHVINDSGGTASAGDFTMTVDDPGTNPADFPGAESPGTNVTVDPGAYSVSETGPSGYQASYSMDCFDSIAIGETKTCTVTNNDIAPKLIVIKHVINDSGGTASAGDFTMTVDDPGTNPADFPGAESPGTNVTVDPGSYSVSETGPSGYAETDSADCSGSIAIGETKTCTVTNNDIAPKLIVIKHVIINNGGGASAGDFTMTVDDPGTNPASFSGEESPGTNVTVDPGSYSVSETGPSGYAETQSADCTGSIAIGETKTCTVTNDDIAAQLTVIKHVINDSGGTASAGDFTMTVDDPGTNPADFPGAESPGTNVAVDPGAYTVSETGPSGYAATYSADCDATIAIGQEKTCTVTNDDIAPKLVVIKHVINDSGGTASASGFTMTVDDPGTNPADFPGAESPGTNVTVDPGSYSVGETGPSGYASSFSADCAGSIAIGETKTCTVTNNDIAPKLIVIKHVINDSGGTASAGDFTMTVDDPGTNPADFPGAESPGTNVTVDPGAYSVSETGPSGYQASYSMDCFDSIAIGETKTCTVTNNDIAPKLIVIKHVINDSGGTASAGDFTMTVDDPGTNPADFPGAESPGTNVTVDPGAYLVSETGPSGYAASYSADCDATIAIGETKTCTVTNNDIAPKLIVIKHVINDNNGTAVAGDFTMTVDDPGTDPPSFPGAESPGTNVTVDPGGYTVGETGPTGYAGTMSGDCTGSIAIGETKTCTVTNDDIGPKLIVIKHVINDSGGTATASSFTMTVDDPGTNPADFPGAESPGTNVTVDPGSYNVTETGPSGYAATYSADCSGSIAIGQTKTCTVTNDDIAPKLIVIKHVINDSGGTASASNFTMTVDDPGTNPADFPGAESPGTNVTIDPGTYSVGETGPSGYASSFSADCAGSIAIGETKTCTVTNNDIAPKLIVIKHVINDNNGTASAGDFTMNVDDQGSDPPSFPGAESPGTNVTVDPGSYVVTESGGPSGYDATVSADCDSTIAIGETKTCTITNDDIAPKLVVIKHVINDSGGTASAGDFTMTVDDPGTNPADFPGAESPGTNVTVDPGSYSVSETGPSGYAASYSADCDATIAIGETKTCTVTNNDIAPKLVVIKHVINDSGGTATAGNFTMTVDDPGTNPPSFPGAESPGTNVTVDPGSYSVSESGPSGYAQTQSSDCTGSIAIGQTKTCTVTNDDIAPKLIVIKHVINDSNGTAVAGDFTMTVDDPGTNPADFPGAESPGTNVTVDPGNYSVSETGPSGYAASYSADCSGSIAIGQTKTCTVTNDDIAPKLIVIKHVINDNGGSATASAFTMTVDDPGINPADFPGAESPGTNVTVDPGNYSVSEAGPSGYAASYSADCSGSIAIGQTKTCTVTNNDIAPKLTVIKHVINDNGGSAAASAFSMTIDDPGTNPPSFPGAESPGTEVAVDAGSYTVGETGPSGYAMTQSADCSGSIAVGQTKTCTVTNNDIAPKLVVKKQVINNNGGSKQSSDFTMTVTGSSPSPSSFAGSSSGTNVTLNAGNYSVSESTVKGYAGSFSSDCSGSIAVGQTKTCTVTNDDFTITTSLTSTGGATGAKITVSPGATVRDVATLVGAPANAGGTVAYKVYTDSNCTNLFATPGAKAVGAGNVAAASDWVKFTTSGTYYWIANYKGNGNVAGVTSACGDEVVTVRVGAEPLTPGYWKNHQQQATPLLPIKLGNYNVSTFALATGVFNNMNCSSSSANGAIGCLSGHLLATKFNLKNGSDSCIQGVVDKADAFLKAQSVTYGGYTATGVNYTGPNATYTLSATQRSLAIALKDALDKYNNGGGC